jgi:hypothetical protein
MRGFGSKQRFSDQGENRPKIGAARRYHHFAFGGITRFSQTRPKGL